MGVWGLPIGWVFGTIVLESNCTSMPWSWNELLEGVVEIYLGVTDPKCKAV